MNYDSKAADEFWSRRVREVDELAAVLHYGVLRVANEAHAKWELTSVFRALPDITNLCVLDLGCGNGRVTVPLAQRSAYVTAIDVARDMLRACRENIQRAGLADRVTFKHASATDLPFADGHFDLVLCLGLLEHLPAEPRQAALAELVRVTRDGGTILLTVNNDQSLLLQRRRACQHTEQYREGELKGFFSGMVGKEWVETFLEQNGLATEIIGTNTFEAFALHLLRQRQSLDDDPELWASLFETCAELDIRHPIKSEIDGLFADQYIIRAVKSQGESP